jgi:hypothetical protein
VIGFFFGWGVFWLVLWSVVLYASVKTDNHETGVAAVLGVTVSFAWIAGCVAWRFFP